MADTLEPNIAIINDNNNIDLEASELSKADDPLDATAAINNLDPSEVTEGKKELIKDLLYILEENSCVPPGEPITYFLSCHCQNKYNGICKHGLYNTHYDYPMLFISCRRQNLLRWLVRRQPLSIYPYNTRFRIKCNVRSCGRHFACGLISLA